MAGHIHSVFGYDRSIDFGLDASLIEDFVGFVELDDVASLVDACEEFIGASKSNDGLFGFIQQSLAARSLVVQIDSVAERDDTLVLEREIEGAVAEPSTKHRVLN